MSAHKELHLSRCNLQPQDIAALPVMPALELTVFAQCHLCAEELDTVAAVCTPKRRVWVVGTSYGPQSNAVANLTLPEVQSLW